MLYIEIKTNFAAKFKITIKVNVKTMMQQIVKVVLRAAVMGDQLMIPTTTKA
jgi:hypothetical protein